VGWSGTTANGAKFLLEMQLVADTDTTQTVRTVIYLTSPNVSDTNNNCSVGGDGYSRSGTLGLGGTYNHVPVWYQDVSHGKNRGSTRVISTNATWSGVDYWGATLSAVAGWTLPPAVTEPDAGVCTAYSTSATTLFAYMSAAGSENGATAIECEYHLYVNGPAGGGGTHVQTMGGFGVGVGYSGGTFYNLTPGATYYVYGRTRNRVGWSAWDVSDAVVMPANPPTLTDAYFATNITRDSMQIVNYIVANTGGSSPNNARVQYNTTPSETGAQVKTAGSWSHVTLTGLTDLTTYYFRVAAANSAGWGPYPATWKSATTLDDTPDSIATPTFSAVTDTSFTAAWVAPNMNGATFSAYRYELSTTSTFASLVTSGTTTSLSQAFSGLTPGTRYYFRVRANASPANGGYGTGNQKTTGIAPNSGLRAYSNVPGVGMRQGTLYANVGGVIRELRPMVNIGGTMQTE
jgi:hypothetical protein